jgi:hypothetical protein
MTATTVGKALAATRAAMGKGQDRAEQADNDHTPEPGQCTAYGCPCRGTVDLGGGGRAACSWHAWAPQDRWQAITRALNEHQWLIDFLGELYRLQYRGRTGEWVQRADQFFELDPDCMPQGPERTRFNVYVWRLREELGFRVGSRKERPVPRLPMAEQEGWRSERTPAPARARSVSAADEAVAA